MKQERRINPEITDRLMTNVIKPSRKSPLLIEGDNFNFLRMIGTLIVPLYSIAQYYMNPDELQGFKPKALVAYDFVKCTALSVVMFNYF